MHCFEGHHVTTLGEITSNSGTHHVQVRKLCCTLLHIKFTSFFPPIRKHACAQFFLCFFRLIGEKNWVNSIKKNGKTLTYDVQFLIFSLKSSKTILKNIRTPLEYCLFFRFWGVCNWNNVETKMYRCVCVCIRIKVYKPDNCVRNGEGKGLTVG